MRYRDGQEIHLGDRVNLGGGASGSVVCSIDTGEFTPEFTAEDWSYLQRGVLVESPQLGLIHYPEDTAELTLLNRAPMEVPPTS